MVAVVFTNLFAELSIDQIHTMVNQIHKKREGVTLKILEGTREPFLKPLRVQKKHSKKPVSRKVEPELKISLHAIMGKKAFINDSWKKVGDTVLGYTLVYIGKSGVVLKNDNQIKKLFLRKHKNSKHLIINERG